MIERLSASNAAKQLACHPLCPQAQRHIRHAEHNEKEQSMKVYFWGKRARCTCNVGAQACPRHPHHLKTKEQKIQFRRDWDARTIESNGGLKG